MSTEKKSILEGLPILNKIGIGALTLTFSTSTTIASCARPDQPTFVLVSLLGSILFLNFTLDQWKDYLHLRKIAPKGFPKLKNLFIPTIITSLIWLLTPVLAINAWVNIYSLMLSIAVISNLAAVVILIQDIDNTEIQWRHLLFLIIAAIIGTIYGRNVQYKTENKMCFDSILEIKQAPISRSEIETDTSIPYQVKHSKPGP